MIHDIDLAQHLFGSAAMRVTASGIAVLGNDEDIAEARIEFTCGAIANLRASRCSFQPERTLNLFGTKGFASVDLAAQRVTVVEIPSWVQQRQLGFLDLNGQQQAFVREHLFDAVLPKRTVDVTPINAIEAEHRDWIEAIESNRDPAVTADQASRNVEIAERVIESIGQHAWSRSETRMCGAFATPNDAATKESIPDILAPSEDSRRAA
jgi:predicted dehydrogenase